MEVLESWRRKRQQVRDERGLTDAAAAQTSQDLVEKDFGVVGAQRLRRHDDLVEVALHQLRHHVAEPPVQEKYECMCVEREH